MILYAEVPGFYAEVERAADPALAERPVVVGGSPRKGGSVQAATADARAAGVEAGIPMVEALQRCPRARARRTDMRAYRDAAARLRACFRAVTERVEPAGLGAAWLELEESGEALEATARALQERVRKQLGLPLRVGAAPIKFLAKIAAEESGSEGFLRVGRESVAAFLGPLPAARLPGVGPNTEARLAALSAHTAAEVAALSREVLEEALGNHGLAVRGHARGEGESHVRPAPRPRTLSQESTLPEAERDRALLRERLQELAQGLEAALAQERMAARRLTLKLRYGDGERVTRSRTLPRAIASAAELLERGEALLDRTQAGSRPVRGLGLAVAGLVRARRDDRQLDLFGSQR